MDIPIAPLFYSQLATAGFSTIAALTILIILNALFQLAAKNPNEPPVVFHWFPFIGNTVSYGIDPYKFFFSCREKVRFVPASSFTYTTTWNTYRLD